MKFYFEKRVVIGFFCAITFLVILSLFSFFSIQRLILGSELLNHRLNVISNSDLVLKSILSIESGERGYVITNDSIFLDTVHIASRALNHYLTKLDSLSAQDFIQSKRVDSLYQLVSEKKAWSDRVSTARLQSFDVAKSMIVAGQGRRITNQIKGCIASLQKHEQENFLKGNTIKENSLKQFQLSFVGMALASAFIMLYMFYLINRALKQKIEAEEKLIRMVSSTKENLEETNYIYRSLAANIPGTAITILDREERYILAEGDLLPKMGYTKEDMPGKKISEIITTKNYEYYEGLIHRAFAGETILVERQTLSGYYTLMKVVPLKKNDSEIFAIMFVLIDVTEIKNVQLKLSELNNELELKVSERTGQLNELNKELEAFTYSVSHDLRAPLRGIAGYAQIIKEEYATVLDDEGKRISDLIILNAVRMGKLIEDMLVFSHIGRKEVVQAPIHMEDLAKEVLKELTANEVNRKLDVRTLTLEPATGDVNMMRQVWVNLISNALKYTSKKDVTVIEMGSTKENNTITYYIRDNGAGFDMRYADKLFGVFQRLHGASDFEGTGVGLALVKTIVKKHGGDIWAESKVGEGTAFYFTLPISL